MRSPEFRAKAKALWWEMFEPMPCDAWRIFHVTLPRQLTAAEAERLANCDHIPQEEAP